MDDLFIRTYIDDVLKNIRTQVLIRLIKPYTRIEIPFISKVRHKLLATVVFKWLASAELVPPLPLCSN